MTEDEAKTKWCCGPKLVADHLLANRNMMANPAQPNPVEANGLCVGSACMAWLFAREPMPTVRDGGAVRNHDGSITQPMKDAPHRRNGSCGLVGNQ